MNKKLLFAAMSLAAFTACTDNDFESQKVAEEVGSVQFEVINNNDAFTRASMNGNTVVFSAKDGDLFTLYHGAALGAVSGFENATYKAEAAEGKPATLTTPSVIKDGGAVMVWPVDTIRYIKTGDNLTLRIPAIQGGKDDNDKETIQNQIPYVSDLIDIEPYAAYSETAPAGVIPTAYKTAGYNRKYAVYMRPMASQLNLTADYAGSDEVLATLYTGDDPIEPISVTSVDLLTDATGTTLFTTEIPVQFTAPGTFGITPATQWTVANNKWSMVTDFNIAGIAASGQTDILTTKCLTGNESSKFLILPQAAMTTAGSGVDKAGVQVNTIYGKVVIADAGDHGSLYTPLEIADAWYRFVSAVPAVDADGETTNPTKETAGPGAGKYKTTSKPEFGMKQTINGFSSFTAPSGYVKGEPIGAAATRYVKVLLNHLDMSDLHIKSDKQLRDAARVWKKMGLTPVTVYLDGDANQNFEISQQTIKTINDINAGSLNFKVQPCQDPGEVCNTITVTGGGDIQDVAFIADNSTYVFVADVIFKAGETWNWKGDVKVTATGVNKFINKGTMVNAATAKLRTKENSGTQNNVELVNDGTWNITGGTLNVQFDVTNNSKVNIAKGAQYRQDGTGVTVFVNNAADLPTRFGGDDAQIGTVENKGVFATVGSGSIANYGLIEHADKDAKTYITTNETVGADFGSAFAPNFGNIKGRINLPYSNKDEDNISISAVVFPAPVEGFVSVTVDGEVTGTLDNTAVGQFVNYMIVKSGVTDLAALPAKVKYLEINSENELYWSVPTAPNLEGLIVLSDVNIKLGTSLSANVTYLGAEMYVGGTFNNTTTNWNGYYGTTGTRVAEHYVTY